LTGNGGENARWQKGRVRIKKPNNPIPDKLVKVKTTSFPQSDTCSATAAIPARTSGSRNRPGLKHYAIPYLVEIPSFALEKQYT
jgi:hypothetical protein